jgi:bile acid:Na+ symporter, BASS family
MRKTVLDIAVPLLVFVSMVVVGMGLTTEDFRRVTRQPGLVMAATVGQSVSLPLIALILVWSGALTPNVEKGMLLVAACPAGSMVNLYTYWARANVALSVTLTAVSCLAALLTVPTLMVIFQAFLGEPARFGVPVPALVGSLLLTLILPILTGMAVRRVWPDVMERHRGSLFCVSLVALGALLGFVIVPEAGHFATEMGRIVLAVGALTGLALASGWGTGWTCGGSTTDRFTLAMVFAVRNVGLATAIAVTALGRVEFAVFAAAYFLAQVPILLAAVLVFRRLWGANGNILKRGDSR